MKSSLLLLGVLALATSGAAAQSAPIVEPPPAEGAAHVAAPPPPAQAEPPARAEPPAQAEPTPPATAPRARRTRLPSPLLYPVRRRVARQGNAGAPFAIGLGGSSLFRRDRAYELFTSEGRTSAFELFASYDLWAPARAMIVAAGVSFRNEALGQRDDLELWHRTVSADLTVRFRAARWLAPHLRAAVGLVATRLHVRDELANLRFEDRERAVAATFGAGLTVHTPSRLFETWRGRMASLSFGLLLEGGYTLAPGAELALEPSGSSDIERDAVSLGTISRSAAYLRIAGVARF